MGRKKPSFSEKLGFWQELPNLAIQFRKAKWGNPKEIERANKPIEKCRAQDAVLFPAAGRNIDS
jgi:hypothetical protein